MGWSENMAKEFKKRNNPNTGPYIVGKVVSGSPLKISIYDGQVLLQGSQLKRVNPWLMTKDEGITLKPFTAGQEVALIGDQTYIILGVVSS